MTCILDTVNFHLFQCQYLLFVSELLAETVRKKQQLRVWYSIFYSFLVRFSTFPLLQVTYTFSDPFILSSTTPKYDSRKYLTDTYLFCSWWEYKIVLSWGSTPEGQIILPFIFSLHRNTISNFLIHILINYVEMSESLKMCFFLATGFEFVYAITAFYFSM